MELRRAMTAMLVSVALGAGCGSDDGAPVADRDAPEQPGPAGSPAPSDSGAPPDDGGGSEGVDDVDDDGGGSESGGGENSDEDGIVEYTISGGHEETGELVWIKVASTYAPGWWSLSFTTRSQDGSTVLSLSLDPSNTNVSYGDSEMTFFGAAPQCTFDVEQDAGGASGSFDCTGLMPLMAADPIGAIDVRGTFEARA